jgi:hypothetical protein
VVPDDAEDDWLRPSSTSPAPTGATPCVDASASLKILGTDDAQEYLLKQEFVLFNTSYLPIERSIERTSMLL